MAEIGFGIAIAAATATSTEAGKHLITKGHSVIEHVLDFPKIVEDLKTIAQTLEAQQEDLQVSINVSQNDNQVIKKIVAIWLVKVDVVLDDVKNLSNKATNPSWWNTLNPFHRKKGSKKALKMIRQIEVLLEEKKQFVDVGDSRPFQSFDLFGDADFEAFASREDATKKVVDALQNTQVTMIGIFGMPGVGKTMLMEAIRKQAKDEKIFDEVVLVTVSQNPDIGTIQRNIAEQLDLHLGESSVDVAAKKLSMRLNQGKKVLIALDDIWERLEMKVVGISYRSSGQGCKILFTTRSKGVCDRMEVQEKIEVGVLSDSDALKLFKQKAGDVVDSFSNQEIVSSVFSECKGLPLAIVTLGLALRNKDEDEWIVAHAQLKESVYKDMGPVISKVKLSYDFLYEYKAAQMCFLFCSLFPEDFHIKTDVLLSFMLGEDLLENVNNMETARKRLHTTVNRLTLSGLLLRSEGGDIMMHDIIRDAAICIASDPKEGEGFIVKSGLGLKEWPPIDRDMEKCRRLSLMRNDLFFCPPRQITASLLLTLSLFENQNLEEIPSDFFKEMKHLKTLDLSRTGIRSFCPSFQCLESLRTLRIDDCFNLIDISLVGKLEMLEILSIYHSPRVQIPVSMQKLINLKMLNASAVKSLFPKKVISSLHRLEELYLDDRGIETELVFSEAASLTRLTCLTICLPVKCMLKDFPIHWINLSKFSIKVGKTEGLMWRDYKSTRSVSLELGSSSQNVALSIPTSNWIGALVEKIEVLEVHYHNHLPTVADLCANVLYQKVSQLYVSNCALLRYLLSATSTVTKPGKALFSNLEKLRLHGLVNFAAICDGPLPEGFLSKLTVLHVSWCPIICILMPFHLLRNLQNLEELKLSGCRGLEKTIQFEGFQSKQQPSLIFRCLRKLSISYCNKLKCVFPLKAARHLMQLEVLDIWQCSNMEIVFEGDRDNGEKDKVSLPCLKTLDLVRLPSLTSFGPQGLLFDFPALIKMEIRDCENLKRLPLFGKDNIPKLKELEVNFGWLDGLDWENEDESLKVHLKSLQGLVEYNDEVTPQN